MKFYSVWKGRFRSTDNYVAMARRHVLRKPAHFKKDTVKKASGLNTKMNDLCRVFWDGYK